MSNNKGFTLIELVIVIVILGILAATAAPKFIDLTGDARGAVIEGLEGTVNSAADIVHAKALIAGKTAATDDSITVGTDTINLAYGWPTTADISKAVEISDDAIDSTTTAGTFTHLEGVGANCYVSYAQPTAAETRPVITSVTEDDDAEGGEKGC